MAKRKQADHRADTRGGALSGLPHAVSDSPAFLHLNPFERAVFAEILRRFNGYNNGSIGISYEEIGERLRGRNRCRPNNGRIARAIARLIEHGFLGEPTAESWLQRRSRNYRVTFITGGKAPPYQQPTNEYLRWQPRVKNNGNGASPDRHSSGDARSSEAKGAGNGKSPKPTKNGSFACFDRTRRDDAGSLLIVKPYQAPKKGGRNLPDLDPQNVDGTIATGRAA